MALDLEERFRKLDTHVLGFLELCLYAGEMDSLFAGLVRDYRFQPTWARAIALYDMFCAPQAPARISTGQAIPPWNLKISQIIETARGRLSALAARAPEAEILPGQSVAPGYFLFDFIVERMLADEANSLDQMLGRFDPARSAIEHLPEGKMTAGRRAFVENTWKKAVRPTLVTAGFWRITTLGG